MLAENTQSRYRALADHAYMLLARRNLAIILPIHRQLCGVPGRSYGDL